MTAADISEDSVTKVLNPDQIICTLDKEQELNIELEIIKGRGFRLSEENKRNDQLSV